MKGVVKIWNDEGELHEVELTHKDIKTLKTLSIELEKVHIRRGLQGAKLKEAYAKDKMIALLNKMVDNQIVWYRPWLDKKE